VEESPRKNEGENVEQSQGQILAISPEQSPVKSPQQYIRKLSLPLENVSSTEDLFVEKRFEEYSIIRKSERSKSVPHKRAVKRSIQNSQDNSAELSALKSPGKNSPAEKSPILSLKSPGKKSPILSLKSPGKKSPGKKSSSVGHSPELPKDPVSKRTGALPSWANHSAV